MLITSKKIDFETTRWDTFQKIIILEKEDENTWAITTFDLTNWVLTFSIKETKDSTTYIYQNIITNHTSPLVWETFFLMDSESSKNIIIPEKQDFKNFFYDVEIKNETDFAQKQVQTILYWQIKFNKDITI